MLAPAQTGCIGTNVPLVLSDSAPCPGLLQPSPDQPGADRRRPADAYIPSWTGGTPAALDIAITSPHRRDIVLAASSVAGSAAEAYEAPSTSYATTSNSNAKQYSADRAGNVHAKGVGAFRSGLSWQRTARQKNLMKSQMR